MNDTHKFEFMRSSKLEVFSFSKSIYNVGLQIDTDS